MIETTNGELVSGNLVYRQTDHAFDVEPHPSGGVTSLLVNELQIEVDEDGILLFVWGYCPLEGWIGATLSVPSARASRARWCGQALVPGVSRRLNRDARWPARSDPDSGWLCVGDPEATGESIAFGPGAICVLQHGTLQALWLRPDRIE